MTATADTPSGNPGLTPAQSAALKADTADGSDRAALVVAHTGEVDLNALVQALMELRRRHDVLRTTIRHGDDGPVGVIGTRTVVPVELAAEPPPHPGDGYPPRRFDLRCGPLVRVVLFSGSGGRALLEFQAHPVVLDEEAIRAAVHELGLLYQYFAGDGPIPPMARIGYQEHVVALRPSVGRVPRRLPVVSHEIDSDTAGRVRLIASSRGLPVALLVLAAWITADAAAFEEAAARVAVSLGDPSGRPPLGPTCDRVLLRADPGSAGDVAALAEQLRTAMADVEPDDGGTPVTFTFHDDGAGAGPFEVVEMGSVLAPSDVSLTGYGTPATGWLLRLTHRADIASAPAVLARTAALLENTGAALIDEELL